LDTAEGRVSFPLHTALLSRVTGIRDGAEIKIIYTGKQDHQGGARVLFEDRTTLAQGARPEIFAVEVQAVERHEHGRCCRHVGRPLPQQVEPGDELVIEDRDLAVQDQARGRQRPDGRREIRSDRTGFGLSSADDLVSPHEHRRRDRQTERLGRLPARSRAWRKPATSCSRCTGTGPASGRAYAPRMASNGSTSSSAAG
jgi:hypothetical protein